MASVVLASSSKKEVGTHTACSFFLTRKKRYCRFKPNNGNKYCSEHIYLLNDAFDRKRIPCPLDPNHTIYEDNIDTHLKKCNKRQRTLPPHHVTGINSGDAEKEIVDLNKLSVLTASSDELSRVITKVEQLYEKHLCDIKKEELSHECMVEEMDNPYYGIQAQRQRKQQASLVSHLEKAGLLKNGSIYVELGAGKGQLSHWVQRATSDDKDSLFILVEKGHIRHKFDRRHQHENGGPKFQRFNIDLEHLNLAKVEDIANNQQQVVGMGKHLCGAGTDFALRCLIGSLHKENQNPDMKITHSPRLAGVVLAPCCHHRCSWTSYVGKTFFKENGLDSSQFQLMTSMCSWATCSWKGWREQEITNHSEHTDNVRTDQVDALKKENEEQFHDVNEHEDNTQEQNMNSKMRSNLKFSAGEREKIGRNCKRIIDYGRLQYLKETGLDVSMKEYIDGKLTPENIVLIAKNTYETNS